MSIEQLAGYTNTQEHRSEVSSSLVDCRWHHDSGLLTGTHDYKWPYHPRPHKDYTVPTVFQAAGPDIASIQGTVDQFRAALGGVNNGNVAGPLDAGRREINWDGGGSTATSPAPTPFSGFLVTRGALFTTPGTGFVQAPLDGLVTTFNNPDYANIFQAFSPVRMFVPVNSNRTTVESRSWRR